MLRLIKANTWSYMLLMFTLISYYIYIIRKTQKTEENYSTKKERPVKDEA